MPPRAAQALAALTPPGLDYVHFVNSGAEATEAALKLARATARTQAVITTPGFHGKTIGALSVTANAIYQTPFQPLLPETTQIAYGCLGAAEQAVAAAPRPGVRDRRTGAGRGRGRIPGPGYLREVAALCKEYGALLVVDEIQTGLGRLGTWWGVDAEGVRPDILLAGKGLSPAESSRSPRWSPPPSAYAPFGRDPYLHTSTFGGSPLACAAALATVETMEREDTVGRAAVLGARILAGLRARLRPVPGDPGPGGARPRAADRHRVHRRTARSANCSWSSSPATCSSTTRSTPRGCCG